MLYYRPLAFLTRERGDERAARPAARDKKVYEGAVQNGADQGHCAGSTVGLQRSA